MIGRFSGHVNRIGPGRKEIFLVKWDQLNTFHADDRTIIFFMGAWKKTVFIDHSEKNIFDNKVHKNILSPRFENIIFFHESGLQQH